MLQLQQCCTLQGISGTEIFFSLLVPLTPWGLKQCLGCSPLLKKEGEEVLLCFLLVGKKINES